MQVALYISFLQAMAGLFLLALAVFVFVRKEDRGRVWPFLLMTVSSSAWVLLDALRVIAMYSGGPAEIISPLGGKFVVLTGWAVFNFAIRFPDVRLDRRRKILLGLALLAGLAAMTMVWSGRWVYNRRFENGIPVADIGWPYFITAGYTLSLVITGLILLALKYRGETRRNHRIRIAINLWGIGIFSFLAYFFSLLLPVLGLRHLFFLGPTSAIFFFSIYFWAILTGRLFDLSLAIRRSVLGSAGIGLCAGLYFGSFELYRSVSRDIQPTAMVLLFIFNLVLAYPIFSRLLPWLEIRLSLAPRYRIEHLIHGLVATIVKFAPGSFGDLGRQIAATIQRTMDIHCVCVLYRRPSGEFSFAVAGSLNREYRRTVEKFARIHARVVPPLLPRDAPNLFWVEDISDTEGVVLKSRYRRVRKTILDFRDTLLDLHLDLYIPVRYEDSILAYYFLGRKKNNEPFYLEEVDRLKAISGVLGVGLKNNIVFNEIYSLKEQLRVENQALTESSTRLTETIISLTGGREIIYTSKKMANVIEAMERTARNDETVLILGESGTGKELAASLIHEKSGRSKNPFIAINCGALSAALLESELFGHEKGSFTGAHRQHLGLFEQCKGGTVFLDEIGDMPLNLQVKLLRVLQEKEFNRIGGPLISADVRVIAATNRPLEHMVAEGAFRQDLFYRLNVLPIELPPLRERPRDIPVLVNYYVKKIAERLNRPPLTVTLEGMDSLKAYGWPGNVRELENMVIRAVVNAGGAVLHKDSFPLNSLERRDSKPGPGLEDSLKLQPGRSLREQSEYASILRSLEMAAGNKSQAAEIMGVSRSTFYLKLRKYRIFS